MAKVLPKSPKEDQAFTEIMPVQLFPVRAFVLAPVRRQVRVLIKGHSGRRGRRRHQEYLFVLALFRNEAKRARILVTLCVGVWLRHRPPRARNSGRVRMFREAECEAEYGQGELDGWLRR